MKKSIIILFSVFFLFSCTDKKKQLISDYEQTIGETKTDLKLKVNSLEFVKSITAKDSFNILSDTIKLMTDIKGKLTVDTLDKEIKYCDIQMNETMAKFDKYSKEEATESTPELLRSYSGLISSYSYCIEICLRAKSYIDKKDQPLMNKWKCSYTIKNPYLNNVEQTITKYYFFNPDNTKIISTESK